MEVVPLILPIYFHYPVTQWFSRDVYEVSTWAFRKPHGPAQFAVPAGRDGSQDVVWCTLGVCGEAFPPANSIPTAIDFSLQSS